MTAYLPAPNTRRHDLDWLRVMAFMLLIFYHTGMIYVGWGFHVRSDHIFHWLGPVMSLSSLFRLGLLFMISGIAVRFLLDKLDGKTFLKTRFVRLFIPLLFAVIFILPPQAYYEGIQKGIVEKGYLTFWATQYFSFTWPHGMDGALPTYNHMWYVLYLLVYSLILLPFVLLARKAIPERGIITKLTSGWRLLILPVIFLALVRAYVDERWPENHLIIGDWGAHTRYGFFFLFGYLVARRDGFHDTVRQALPFTGVAALVLGLYIWLVWSDRLAFNGGDALGELIVASWRWWFILALFGLAQKFLNRPGKALTYLIEAVYPYYILHQTLLIIAFGLVMEARLGPLAEPAWVLSFTFCGCLAGYEVIRRISWLRPLFGLKPAFRAAARKPK